MRFHRAPCLTIPSDFLSARSQEQSGHSALVLQTDRSATLMLMSSSTKKVRNRVDLSSKELARHWCKHLGKSKLEIEAAIAKVGDNAETVMKELGAKRGCAVHPIV
jgi:Protein of unknown function (DUF3606)